MQAKIHFERDDKGQWHVRTALTGEALLRYGLLNKGTAFSGEERKRLHLEGLLPDSVSELSLQAERAYRHLETKTHDLDKYIELASLQDRNEVLFFKVLQDHITELLPIVYTPIVGEAVQKYSRIFRRTRGVWITPEHRGRIAEVLGNVGSDEIRLIVVTDNERILGLGDQGAGGMGIPIGKLALYTAAAGIHPALTLPVSLDVGTNNQALLDDPLYLGWRHPRLRGEAYDALVEEFVEAVKQRFPTALLQWEDFKKRNAFDLLERYRKRIPSFNDDIEGTAAVAVAGVMAASRVSQIPLAKQRILILGAGAAGVGIARLLRDALSRAGVSGDALIESVAMTDSQGPLVEGRAFDDAYKSLLAWPRAIADRVGFGSDVSVEAVVEAYKPTALIGTTGRAGSFTEEAIRRMASHVDRPAIFPFSNPTSLSEAHPADLLAWTNGRALVASGSPFGTVFAGGKKVRVGQGNNVFVFPGVGLGCLVAEVSEVVPSMFAAAAETLAKAVTDEDLEEGALFPKETRLGEVSRAIAIEVAKEARKLGLGKELDDDTIVRRVDEFMWTPSYPVFDSP